MEQQVYLFAIGANLSFALGSQFFTYYSRAISSSWMNWFKASVALILFGLWVSAFGTWHEAPLPLIGLLFLSGFIGLGTGDIFLLKSFSDMGPGRTMMLFAFQPLFLGVFSYFLFNQGLDSKKFWAILFFIICILIFSLESFKLHGHWQIKSILLAFTGMIFDASGILITRYVFDAVPSMDPMEGNFYRCIGAILLFLILSRFRPLKFWEPFNKMDNKNKSLVLLGSFLGTFLSLSLYLAAVQKAHLASLSGIAITGTIFSSIFECLIQKKWPSRYLMTAFVSFLVGMKILMF